MSQHQPPTLTNKLTDAQGAHINAKCMYRAALERRDGERKTEMLMEKKDGHFVCTDRKVVFVTVLLLQLPPSHLRNR